MNVDKDTLSRVWDDAAFGWDVKLSEREHVLRPAATHPKVVVVLMVVKLKFAVRVRKPEKWLPFGLALLSYV
jgi:hypothetical protein